MKVVPGKVVAQAVKESPFQTGALVMYENDGAPILAVIAALRKDKFLLFNERGREVEMAANRLYALPGRMPTEITSIEQKTTFLSKLHKDCAEEALKIRLDEVWSVVKDEDRPYSTLECCELSFGDNLLPHHVQMRFALMNDKVFFKRNKEDFSPRPEHTVEELKKAEASRREKELAKEATLSAFKKRLVDHTYALPPESAYTIRLLEDTAAFCDLDHAKQKEVKELLENIGKELGQDLNGTKEQQAFSLLLKIGHFHRDTNLALVRYRPAMSFSSQVEQEAAQITLPEKLEQFPEEDRRIRQNLTHLDVFTIDDISTRDIDDGLSLERTPNGYRLGIHVSDVATFVAHGSALDDELKHRATSIYIPELTIHMMPDELAANKLSLVASKVRPAISCLFELDRSLNILSSSIVPSLIEVKRRCTYDEVDEILESGHSGDFGTIYELTVNQEMKRSQNGAFKVFKHDLMIEIDDQGEVSLKEFDEHGPARGLVGETMIMANSLLAAYAKKHSLAVAFRSQEASEEVDAQGIPAGPALDYAMRSKLKKSSVSLTPAPHAGLGLEAYIQATSPIRRYLDLCHQRQIMHHIKFGKAFYTAEEFEKILIATEQPLSDAQQIQKESKRYWLLRYLQQRTNRRNANGERNNTIKAIVLRTDLKNPLVEVDEVFINALVKVNKPVKVGDEIHIRIAAVDPRSDYLKLEQVE